MDVFDYRSSRSLNTEGIFTVTGTSVEISGVFMRLKNLMTTEIHLQWDIAFLEQYQKEKLVPRGLRWDIHPQQGDDDLQAWSRYFNEAGLNLLEFLTGRKKSKLKAIDSEIKTLREQLLPHKTSPEYISLSSNLQGILEKEERDQRFKKQKKIYPRH